MAGTFDLEMAVEVLYAADKSLALGHVGSGAQSDGVAFLAALDSCVRLVGVAPGSASVDECLVLAGNVCPVGGGDGYDDVCFVEFVHDAADDGSVRHDAGSRQVAGSAAFAECESVVVDANGFGFVAGTELAFNDLNDLGCGACSYGTAVDNKCFHHVG